MILGKTMKEITLADLGGVPSARPPYGTQFFRFRIHFHRKVPTSEVRAPPAGNPGSATEIVYLKLRLNVLQSTGVLMFKRTTHFVENEIKILLMLPLPGSA